MPKEGWEAWSRGLLGGDGRALSSSKGRLIRRTVPGSTPNWAATTRTP